MYAVLTGEDGRLHWAKAPEPVIGEAEVLLEIHAAALNRADLLQRAGQYPPPPGWPEWLGLEAAGVIAAIGKKVEQEGRWHVGDCACALLGGGGYAQYAAVPEGMLMPIPKGLTMVEAAALPEAFGAAYLFLFLEGQLRKNETLLVQAGASGLASVLIPMAKAFGARVITTVLSNEIAASIAHLKADIVVNTTKSALDEVMKTELDQGRGVDMAIDCLGGEMAGKCLPYMNRGGRWIVIATLAGDIAPIDLRNMYARGTRIMGTTLRSRSHAEKKALLADMAARIWPMVERGEIRPTIHRVFPIQQAEDAHALMQSGKNVGKIVLAVRE